MNEKKESEYNEDLYNRFFEIVGSPEEGADTGGGRRISQSKAAQAIGYCPVGAINPGG
jgi:hypothetical protein